MNFVDAVRNGLNQIRFTTDHWLEDNSGCLVGAALHSEGFIDARYPHRDLERLWPWTAEWKSGTAPCCGKQLDCTFAGFCIHLADHLEKQELTRAEVLDILAQQEPVHESVLTAA